MYITLKSGKLLILGQRNTQVVGDGAAVFGEALPRHDHRDAGRVGTSMTLAMRPAVSAKESAPVFHGRAPSH